jgi:drug/metabolite transporter (DMT)-like permease
VIPARAIPFAFVLLWSSSFVAVQIGLRHLSPLLFVAVRLVLCASVLTVVATWRGVSLRDGTAARTTANFYLVPGTTALLTWIALGDRLTAPALGGFVVAGIGCWLVSGTAPR